MYLQRFFVEGLAHASYLFGAEPLSSLRQLKELSETELKNAARDGAVIIDTRAADDFGAGHFRCSTNIGLGSPSFSTWVGFMIPGDKPIAPVVGSAEEAQRARLELARIGTVCDIPVGPAIVNADVRSLKHVNGN